ncbi:DNA polymerase subunit Cdc27 [Flammula alnicola]|nr:DNA polymerase subunit Cdc27 [Flammula alnicola]
MTTQAIADYLTKQIFIEKNIVTYRSLSRHFSIHVNTAKNELATYHHNAPYQSQTCLATFFLSGTVKNASQEGYDEDVDMDSMPTASQGEEYDGDEVPQTKIMIVNERDLEAARASYEEIHSIHVYSLSPSALHDAGLLCAPTAYIRDTDKAKGKEFAATIGRVVGRGIKVGASKKKAQPPAPVAGPSKLKPAVPESKPVAKAEGKEASSAAADKAKEKPKATGKLEFFSKPKETAAIKIKKEESAVDKKKLFFSKPAAKAPSRAASVSSVKDIASTSAKEVAPAKEGNEQPARGVKRKSSVGLETRERTPENRAIASESNARAKRRVVLSDDEEDTISTRPTRRKSRASFRTESTDDSEAERKAAALMDIDDDQVERVSRVPSTNASSNERDDDDGDDSSVAAQEEDISMAEDVPAKPKVKPRKPKTVVPVGRNGLKKRKLTKTRRTVDANGYMRKEDYSDWESVEEGDEPEPAKAKAKAKPKAAAVKKEDENEEMPPPPAIEKEAPPKKAPAKPTAAATKSKPAAKTVNVKGKGQQKLNFLVRRKHKKAKAGL